MSESKMVSDHIVDWLIENNITTGFGVPGGGLAKFYSSICRDARLKIHLCQHECGAAYMAMGYNMSRKSGAYAFCFGTGGPGATNLLTGIAAADHENLPLLVITGNVATELFGKGAAHDSSAKGLDIESIYGVSTGKSKICEKAEDIISNLNDLWRVALESKRPVHLSLPVNISMEKVHFGKASFESEVAL